MKVISLWMTPGAAVAEEVLALGGDKGTSSVGEADSESAEELHARCVFHPSGETFSRSFVYFC